MVNFKVLVKVNPDSPLDAAKILGKKVVDNEDAFASTDPIWIAQQDYITVVPIEVALTVEMRAVIQTNSPETRFIVTGVTSKNVSNLVHMFGYTVFPSTEIKEESSPKKEDKEVPVKEDKEVQSAGADSSQRFWYNGKEISEKEFNKRYEAFKTLWKEVWNQDF